MVYKVKIEILNKENESYKNIGYPYKEINEYYFNTGTEAFQFFLKKYRLNDFFAYFEETDETLIFTEYDEIETSKVILYKWDDFDKYSKIKWNLIDDRNDSNILKSFKTVNELIKYYQQLKNTDEEIHIIFDDDNPSVLWLYSDCEKFMTNHGTATIIYDYHNPEDNTYIEKNKTLKKQHEIEMRKVITNTKQINENLNEHDLPFL